MSLHKHHRKLRSQGGDNSWGNLILVPPEIHELIHHHPEVAKEHGLLVHPNANPHEIKPDIPGFLQSLGVESEPEQKQPKKRLQGTERRKRATISVKVPKDTEDGAGIYDDTLERVKERLVAMGLYAEGDQIPTYEATIAAWTDWLNS